MIDTIILNPDNTFFKKFDSLAPGLYSFKHEPEYQYIYFDKNDSIMVRLNSQEFDESIMFCGRGDEKNNFLMELFLKNEHDRDVMFDVFNENISQFNFKIDSAYQSKQAFYQKKKESIEWSEDFDEYALAMLNFFHYSKKELYPVIHKMRSGIDVEKNLPKDFYDYRKDIDFNNNKFTNFSPFVRYLSNMMNNLSENKQWANRSEIDKAFLASSKKLQIADSIFTNEKIKNTVLDNIAFTYLLEDQNIINNKKFLDQYHRLSTDKNQHNEIKKIGDAIQKLKENSPFPDAKLVDINNNVVLLSSAIQRKTVVFFWTKNLESHFVASHKRVMELQSKHPDYDFVSICVDENQDKWLSILKNYPSFKGFKEYRVQNFEEIRERWVVNKIHRTIILNSDGTVNNAFVSLFDIDFAKNLK
ncbi:thioredoxin-like domain-containing protein [Flavobacterium sp.]|uniref:TlpA family protein disulfide reductase n=1 Tax=Flavobacterium sp. TaxID=239 RepID=UPI0026320E3D|nr:thioredoxin-like domain-containing protein [Flavobacterium sp.]MDD3004822.1 thioredoxin-like domain-containing protein [Flavobacterium sp.]